MNWKNPVILAVVLTAMIVVYVVYQPVESRLPDRRLVESKAIDRLEIDGPDGRIEMIRKLYGTKAVWFVTGDPEIRVDPFRVTNLSQGMRKFATLPVRPESKDWSPDLYGVEGSSALTVRAYSGEKVFAFTFGKSVPLDDSRVFVRLEGNPSVWRTEADARKAFEGDAASFRDPALAFWNASMVTGLTGRRRVLVGTSQGPAEKIYEHVMRRHQGAEKRGWYLEKPFEERLVDHAVGGFLTELTKLKAEAFVPLTPEMESRLEKAPFSLEVTLAKRPEPARYLFGEPEKKGAPVPVRVDDADEVAMVPSEAVERIPRDYQPFRDKKAFRFDTAVLKEMAVTTRDGHRMVLRSHQEETDGIVKKKWRMTEPSDVDADPARLEPFIDRVLKVDVVKSEGVQPSLGPWGLDDPEVVLAFTLGFESGEEKKVYRLGRMDDEKAFMTLEGSGEIFEISSFVVRGLSVTDLNVRIKDLFMMPREGIKRIYWLWGAREDAGAGGDHYDVRRGADGKWTYADRAHVDRKKEVDGHALGKILNHLNFIKAEEFLGRGEEYIRKSEMTRESAHGHLLVEYEEDGEEKKVEVFFSDDIRRNRSRGEPRFCARFAHSDIVFYVSPALVGELRNDVDERPDLPGDGHRH